MLETLPWVVALILGGIVIWRTDRLISRRLDILNKQAQNVTGDSEVTLMERRTQAEIAQRTIDQTVALRQADLAKQTAEVVAQTEIVNELRADRLESERRILAAHTKAQEDLAQEFARARHEAELEVEEEDLVDQYTRLLQATSETYAPDMSFSSFHALMTSKNKQ